MAEDIRQGATASFALGDIVCPDVTRTLEQIGPELSVTGKITMLSDRGSDKNAFAIVQVSGIHSPLIVPVSRLRTGIDAVTTTDQDAPKIFGRQSA